MDEVPRLADLGMGLDDLIHLVHAAQAEGDELACLRTAVMIAERLGELGDHLIGHFVDQARHAGASWTTIGASMGVTKQAVQKRFVPEAGDLPADSRFSRFTPRARRAVGNARKAADRMKNPQVGTEHLILGLVGEREGIAAKALEAQGVTARHVRQSVAAAGVPIVETSPDPVPFASASKKALATALREALRMGHDYIGTEHLLLAVLADNESVGSRVLLDLGATKDRTADWVAQALSEIAPPEAE
jgi:hypothetical protein